jgi:hypothetical protein
VTARRATAQLRANSNFDGDYDESKHEHGLPIDPYQLIVFASQAGCDGESPGQVRAALPIMAAPPKPGDDSEETTALRYPDTPLWNLDRSGRSRLTSATRTGEEIDRSRPVP